jgi:hypothetical protein
MAGGGMATFDVDLADALDDFEEPGAAADAIGFQGGRDGQADGLVGAAGICHQEISFEWVKPP